MPIGIIVNSLSVLLGGIIGSVGGSRLSSEFKSTLNILFGYCAMCMGISSIVLMENMPAVIFSAIVGTSIGVVLGLESKINAAGAAMQRIVSRFVKSPSTGLSEEEYMSTLITVIVLFCASGTGIYGSIVSGMTGDHTILIAKSILDIFTAVIFACTLGITVSVIALPQFIIFCALFICAGFIYPLTTPAMINDFKACGGLLLFVTGFRMIKVRMFPIANMIPALVIVMPVSALWVSYILPLVS